MRSHIIDKKIAKDLILAQFPNWKDLPIIPVRSSGWDNTTFRLGETMLLRFPSNKTYAESVKKSKFGYQN